MACYNLFQGLKRQDGWDAHYLAGVGPPLARRWAATPLMSLRRELDETLYWASDYDWFHLGSNDLDGLMKHFERFLADCHPDVVNVHHVMGLGVQDPRGAP